MKAVSEKRLYLLQQFLQNLCSHANRIVSSFVIVFSKQIAHSSMAMHSNVVLLSLSIWTVRLSFSYAIVNGTSMPHFSQHIVGSLIQECSKSSLDQECFFRSTSAVNMLHCSMSAVSTSSLSFSSCRSCVLRPYLTSSGSMRASSAPSGSSFFSGFFFYFKKTKKFPHYSDKHEE
jgi:hypothetical protein